MKNRYILANSLLLALGMTLATGQAAPAATITVTTSNDLLDAAVNCNAVTVGSLPGPGGVTSLREAICAANNNAGADTIHFNIPCPGVQTIDLSSALPPLTENATTIDGYTQPGAAPATAALTAAILIEINGTAINNNGLNIISSRNVIRGLAIYGFNFNEIHVASIPGYIANDNVIAGNYLGTNAGGALCPTTENRGYNGVFVGEGAQNNLIGGNSPADRNLISCNGYEGVGIHHSGTTGNIVAGNYIGTDPLGTTSLGNTWDGVRIYGGAQNNTVGGATAGERNVISGNRRDGVRLIGVDTMGNLVMGNYIGLRPDGAGGLGNDYYGVYLGGGAQSNTIGGDRTAGEGNVISGNGDYGIAFVDEATGNIVSGNTIGLAADDTTLLPNADTGVHLGILAQNNTIGGDSPGKRNIISGNGRNGITIEGDGNIVSGNYIGTETAGLAARGNAQDGIFLTAAAENNLIGGNSPGQRNLISGNGDDGITLDGGDNNRVSGNYIGTNAVGTAILGNADFGMLLENGAQNNTIGGDSISAGNVIAGSFRDGIYISDNTTAGNVVANNRIGTDPGGTLDLGNGQSGIQLDFGTHGNIIGPGNVVAYNKDLGIWVRNSATFGNPITRNSIFANTDQGIHLTPGAHGGIQPPVITTVNPSPLTVVGTVCPNCTVELFGSSTNGGQGQFYLGNATADGSGVFSLARTTMPYPYLTATATDSTNGTSEFSAVLTTTVVLVTHLPVIVR